MNYNIESMLYDFIVDNNIATENEIRLVTAICGWSEQSMLDIIFARTEYHSYEQCMLDGNYYGTDELNRYYDLNQDSEDEEEED